MAITYTPNYNLSKYDAGDTGWDTGINSNFDTIDTTLKDLQDQIDNLVNVYLKLDGSNSPTKDIDFSGHRITNAADPVNAQDYVTKNYNDTQISNLDNRITTNESNISTNTTNINNHLTDEEAHKLQILKAITFGSWIYPYYAENTYSGNNCIQTNIWEDNTKTNKFGYIDYSYNSSTNLIDNITISLTTNDGNTVVHTINISLTYDSNNNILTETQTIS